MTKKIIKYPDLERSGKLAAFDRLLNIMDELRENCPWDKKQTMESLRHLTIEETYELSDAILEGDLEEVKEELGDLMLHLTFYARLGAEKKAFDMGTALNGICEKLIRITFTPASKIPFKTLGSSVDGPRAVSYTHLTLPTKRIV